VVIITEDVKLLLMEVASWGKRRDRPTNLNPYGGCIRFLAWGTNYD